MIRNECFEYDANLSLYTQKCIPQLGHILIGLVQRARKQVALLAQLRDRRRRPPRLRAERGGELGLCVGARSQIGRDEAVEVNKKPKEQT